MRVRRVAAAHRVVAAAAVHVQVDEAGQQQRQRAAPRGVFVDRVADDGGDAAVGVVQRAPQPALRREDVALQHGGGGAHRARAQWLGGALSSSVGASAGTRKRSLAQAPRSALRQRSLQNGRHGLRSL